MRRIGKHSLLIGIISLAGLSIRAWGIGYDLPYIYHPDEPYYIVIIQNIFKTGDLNPHFFNYPSLFFYINALAYIPYFLIGKFMGILHTPNDILPPITLIQGVTIAQLPTTVLLGRMVSICFGVGAIVLAYLIGRQVSGRTAVGLIAALMVAVSPTNVYHSRLITPDTILTFFVLASLLASILVYQQGKTWQYIVAGLCVGFAASSKYNGGMIILPLLLAHSLHYGKTSLKQTKLYLALLFCGIGFLLTTPYAILDSVKFLTDFRFEAHHYSTGHAGMDGNSPAWYLDHLWKTAGGLYLLAVIGIFYGAIRHPKQTSLLLIFPLIYFIWISSFVVRNARTILPMIAFLFLFAAWLLVDLFEKIKSIRAKQVRWLSVSVVAGLSIIALVLATSKTIADTLYLTTVNSRETSRIWIDENLPPGARIGIESYSPFVNPSRFSVVGIPIMIEHDAEWYIEQGFEYLIFSEGMFGRFFAEPDRYKTETSKYEKLFGRFTLVKMFADGDFIIRIYKVN
jgi:4-amino-4-deoxy-L-arabinose transferase-like glycosyltransferase